MRQETQLLLKTLGVTADEANRVIFRYSDWLPEHLQGFVEEKVDDGDGNISLEEIYNFYEHVALNYGDKDGEIAGHDLQDYHLQRNQQLILCLFQENWVMCMVSMSK